MTTPNRSAQPVHPASNAIEPEPDLANAELVQLRVRVIALENLLIAVLAEAPERQRELARQMAAYISPRPGFSAHPMTLNAAQQMVHLVGRAHLFTDTTEHMAFGATSDAPDAANKNGPR